MIRIKIAAPVTGEDADVLALHGAVCDATTEPFTFTLDDEGLVLNIAGPDLPAVLAVILPAEALGQITTYAAETPLLATA